MEREIGWRKPDRDAVARGSEADASARRRADAAENGNELRIRRNRRCRSFDGHGVPSLPRGYDSAARNARFSPAWLACRTRDAQSMVPKSGHRFSEKTVLHR